MPVCWIELLAIGPPGRLIDATGGRETGLNDPGVEVNEDDNPVGAGDIDTRRYFIDGNDTVKP